MLGDDKDSINSPWMTKLQNKRMTKTTVLLPRGTFSIWSYNTLQNNINHEYVQFVKLHVTTRNVLSHNTK